MKHFAIIISALLFFSACSSDPKPADSSAQTLVVKQQATTMGELLLKNNFREFSKFTYPKVVEMMGGKEKMVEQMEEGLKQMSEQGTGFLSVTLGEPSKIVTEKNELQCTLQQTIEMKVPEGKMVTVSTLIAISTDGGKNWYFVDTPGKDIQAMKKLLPNLSDQLVIPERKEPQFYKD